MSWLDILIVFIISNRMTFNLSIKHQLIDTTSTILQIILAGITCWISYLLTKHFGNDYLPFDYFSILILGWKKLFNDFSILLLFLYIGYITFNYVWLYISLKIIAFFTSMLITITFSIIDFGRLIIKNGNVEDKTNYKGNKSINGNQLQDMNGIFYKINEKTPYTGENSSYYETGEIKSNKNYIDGKLNGEIIQYYKNCGVESKDNYIDGELNGVSIQYYSNGNIESNQNYINGKLDGVSILYFRPGQIEGKYNYINGKPDGVSIEYYSNGQIESKGNYKDGNRNGEWVNYYKNGKIEFKENYKDGNRNGEWIYYDENDKIEFKENYKDGKLIN